MADQKVSALTAILGADVDAAADFIPIVDTSAGAAGSKKILVEELAAALPVTVETVTEEGPLDPTAAVSIVDGTAGPFVVWMEDGSSSQVAEGFTKTVLFTNLTQNQGNPLILPDRLSVSATALEGGLFEGSSIAVKQNEDYSNDQAITLRRLNGRWYVFAAGGDLTIAGLLVALTPDTVSIVNGATQQFTKVINVETGAVNALAVPAAAIAAFGFTGVWSVDGGAPNGTITQGGLYTAPATPGDYLVFYTLTNGVAGAAAVNVT